MPAPEVFFPGAHRIVTRRSMLISWLVGGFYVLADWVHACIKKAIHMQAHTHTHTHTPANTHIKALRILGYWQTAYTPLWVPMPWVKLSDTFHTGSTYTTLSPWGLHWRCPFANNSIMDTHIQCLDAHTFLNTHTAACTYATTCTRWSNYRHFNHWTLLLWGTADIAGSGQKKRPLTDFNLGLMIVVWAWLLCCSNYGRCHFLSGNSGRIKDTLGCLDWIKAAFFLLGEKIKILESVILATWWIQSLAIMTNIWIDGRLVFSLGHHDNI